MKYLWKKLSILMLVAAVLTTTISLPVCAEETKKTVLPEASTSAGPWNVAEGVIAWVAGTILYVDGNGAVPDYAADALNMRPWKGQFITGIWICDGITEIGTNAFAKLGGVSGVRIPSTVFVKDASSFAGIAGDADIRISGKNVATKMIGGIPYTSAMSIISWVQNQPGFCVRTDFDKETKKLFMTQNYPYLRNVGYSVDSRDYLFNPLHWDPDFGYPTTPIVKWTTGASKGYTLKCEKYVPGENTMIHFSNFLGDNTYGAAFRMWAVNPSAKKVNETPGTCTYQLDIPAELVATGRTFKLIAVVDNKTAETIVLDDLDANDATFTFQSDKIPYQCALVYKDAVVQ